MAKPRHKRPDSLPADQGENWTVGNCKPPLHSRFKPGQSGNPAGRPSAGAAMMEWLGVMNEWTKRQLEAVVNDVDAPASKVSAARVWLDAMSKERTSSGSPIAGPEFDRILDRTIGKPAQAVDVTSKGESIYLKDIRGVSTDDL